MSIDLFSAELVESYLNNELTAEERKQFDQNLQDNPEFSDFFNLYNDVDKAVAEQDVMELRQELNSIFEVASEVWLDEAPMLKTDTHEVEIEKAITEEDVMELRSLLNDIHDLNQEELISAQNTPVSEAVNSEDTATFIEDGVIVDEDADLFENEMYRAIMEEDVMNLRNSLQKIAKEATPVIERKPFIQRFSRITAIASIFLLVLLGGTFLVSFTQPMKAEKAGEKYFGPIEKSVTRGGDIIANSNEQRLNNFYNNYREENYSGAIEWFNEVKLDQLKFEEKVEILAYAGVSYLIINNTENAISLFNEIIENRDHTSYGDKADWYLAACYLRNESTEAEGITLLQEIAALPDHDYNEESLIVLKKMKKLKI